MNSFIRRFVVIFGLAAMVSAPIWYFRQPDTVTVAAGGDVNAAIAAARPRTNIVLEAGMYEGPIVVDKRITLKGELGATIVAPTSVDSALLVAASNVTIADLAIEGGSSGLTVREVQDVSISGVTITGSEVHGIEVVDATAHIKGAHISGLLSSLAQGIEIRNADGRPDSSVEGSTVIGGQEGIVTHVSEVRFVDNDVSETTMRGIVVTEMSDGFVEGNTVEDSAGSGLYCGDMSRCQFENNVVGPIAMGDGGISTEGWGLVVTYHAAASNFGNELDGASGPLMTSLHGHIQDRSPLDPGTLADLAPAMTGAILIAALLCLVSYGLARLVGPFLLKGKSTAEIGGASLPFAIVGVILVQSFHMIEHFLQIFRIHVDHIPSRGGLAGPGVDSEWVHMAYNGVVFLLLVAAVVVLRGRVSKNAVTLALGAVLLQSWHVVEHVAKVTSHVRTGMKVNAGILGQYFDLAWFHFTINLAVYGLSVGAAALALASIYKAREAALPASDASVRVAPT